jgi:hypothetical protein
LGLSLTCSFSLVIRCTCKIRPKLSAVDVGEGREMLTVQSEAVEREWGDGGGSELDPLDLARYPLYL